MNSPQLSAADWPWKETEITGKEPIMPIRTCRKAAAVLAAILLSLLCISAFAQQSNSPNKRHILWKVSSKTNTVYILGSVHLLKRDAYPLDTSIEKAYESSSRLFFEINLDMVDKQKLQQLTIAKGVYRDGRTLKDDLSKQTYEYAKKRLSDLGLKIENVETLKPWLLAMTLEVSELQKLGYDASQGVDQYFYKKAKNDGKKVDGFETAEYQVNLFGDMPAGMQEALLLQTMRDLDEAPKVLAALVEAWKSGDAETLDNVLLKSIKDFPDLNKALITDRNKKWLPAIESLVGRKENVMIIVGAAHLVGRDGIIAALKQKGYQVEQQ